MSNTSAAVVLDRNPTRSRRVVNRAGMIVAIVVGYLGLTSTGAFAQTAADPTGGMFTSLQSNLTGTLIPASAALIVVGIVFALAVKYVKKAVNKA